MCDFPNFNCFGFVVDTDTYAGNFERYMCAYMTGIVGGCGVGDKYVDESIEEKFKIEIAQVCDDNGCYRPCSITGTKKYGAYNSVVIYLRENPTQEIIDYLKQKAYEFPKVFLEKKKSYGNTTLIKVEGFQLLEFKVSLDSKVI